MSPLEALQFLFLVIMMLAGGVMMALGFQMATKDGRRDLRKYYIKWRLRRQLKSKFENTDFATMLGYSESDIRMTLALHKHITKPHATIYDMTAFDHGFYPHEDNDTENA